MIMRIGIVLLALLMVAPGFSPGIAQSGAAALAGNGPRGDRSPTRDQTVELLRASLARYGALPEVNIAFHQVEKNPFNFSGNMTTGLKNADALEVVIGATPQSTISVRVYPHYKGAYINVEKVHDPSALMRKMLVYSNNNFLFWGADAEGDTFAGYTITLESGYPDEVVSVVLRSIHNTDQFVGEMRPFIDGTAAPQ
jgi:hypothetical protein